MYGMMAKCSVKISDYDLVYEPRTTIKSQALADFVADFSTEIQQEADWEVQQLDQGMGKWAIRFDFQATKNEAEYEGSIAGLQLARDLEVKHIHVPREGNVEDDALENLGSAFRIPTEIKIPIIRILNPATDIPTVNKEETTEEAKRDLQVNEVTDSKDIANLDPQANRESWIRTIKEYLVHNRIPKDENPKAFRMKAFRFIILDNILYKKSLTCPYLRCLEELEAQEFLKDIHEGDCGNHTGGRSLFSTPLGLANYQKLRRKVFILAKTDHFSKWIEAEAFSQVREQEEISFIKWNVLTRFGIPAEIICNNRSQFTSKKTTEFCVVWGVKMITSTPVHHQANGQAKSSNKIIVNNLMKKLEAKKGKWAEELPFILWADGTTSKNATGQTLFFLVFGQKK
ncbi:uncharacterized protein LOC143610675 [Bidens hawaiensis]|uniref:uncharacterized protein LOC143610675 n=1 Tax=Bidens hawaiensis TaxID=980011 RepID=UPI00404B7E6C